MQTLHNSTVTAPNFETRRSERIESRPGSEAGGTRTGWPMRATYLASDVVTIGASIAVAVVANNLLGGLAWNTLAILQAKLIGLLAVALLGVAGLQRTYAAIPSRPVRQFHGWATGAAAVCFAEIAILKLFDSDDGAICGILIVATMLSVLMTAFNRAMCRVLFGSASWWGTRLIVVGSGGLGAEACDELNREPQWGLRPVGYVDDMPGHGAIANTSSVLASPEQLDELAASLRVDRGLAVVQSFDADEFADLICRADSHVRHWIIRPRLHRFPCLWTRETEVGRQPALAVTNRLAIPWMFASKRCCDVAVAAIVGLIALPILVAIALLVRFTSAGPIFYGQQRIGLRGRRFMAWKFRTMFPDAAAKLQDYLADNPELAAEWHSRHKLKHDPRITWIGGWLRKTSLDELPQIWNVLVGDMSLVGPRPIVHDEINKYADRYERFVQVLPGITGLWQVSGRNNTTYEERVALDMYYVQNWSLWLDFYILACTVKVVLRREGAY